MKYGKWIGGGLGWALGGAIGALVGFAIGALFDSGDSDGQGQQSRRTSQGTGPGDFKMSLLVLIACIVKADGIARESEMAIVRRILVSNFGRAEADEAMSILNRLLVQEIDETEVARQIDRNMNYSSKLELLHLLFQIAYADGEVNYQELSLLQRIAGIFGISHMDFNAIRAPYTRQNDAGWAYKALGITSAASDDEIKSAYRKMAMKYHPDKLSGLGEDVRKAGEEKFRAVKDAYDFLKRERNIR